MLGEPDLVVKSQEITVPAHGPDRWGSPGVVPTGLHRRSLRVVRRSARGQQHPEGPKTNTVGGRYVWHHQTYPSSIVTPSSGERRRHELADSRSRPQRRPVSRGRRPAARGEFGARSERRAHPLQRPRDEGAPRVRLQVLPEGLPAEVPPLADLQLGNGNDLDVKPNTANQEIHAYATLQENTKIIAFEPHLHAPGVRMCLEAIWGMNIQQLSCVGYDHNWVKQYIYEDDAAPLLPKGTIVHLIGFLDTYAGEQEPGGSAQLGRRRTPVDRRTCSSTLATRSRSPTTSSRRRWRSAART